MDDISEQYDAIESISSAEGIQSVHNILNTEKYRFGTSPNIENLNYYNPCVDMYHKEHNWTEEGWDEIWDTGISHRCPEYLPTDSLIKYLTTVGKIAEIGAGDGYWSHVINQNGGDCLPTDINPSDLPVEQLPDNYHEYDEKHNMSKINVERPFYEDCSSFPCHREVQFDGEMHTNIVWSEVRFANHKFASETDREFILLCHPVKFSWVDELLDIIIEEQKKLILVAEWGPSQDATPSLFVRLDRRWNLEKRFNVVDWSSMDVGCYVFSPPEERKSWKEILEFEDKN